MTDKECEKLITPFTSKADKDNDPYLVVHFSREQDYFKGYHERMDSLDAMIVIKNLVNYFKINEILLKTAIEP